MQMINADERRLSKAGAKLLFGLAGQPRFTADLAEVAGEVAEACGI